MPDWLKAICAAALLALVGFVTWRSLREPWEAYWSRSQSPEEPSGDQNPP